MIGLVAGFLGKRVNLGKLLAIVGISIAVAGTIYAGYRYVSNLQDQVISLTDDNAVLTTNNENLKLSIETQKETIETLQEDSRRQNEILNTTLTEFDTARQQVDRLQQKLSEHDIGFLAASRPGLVERIINKATDDTTRCFEIASGALLTSEELNATLPSEINNSCPDLANPSYKDTNE